MRFDYLLTTNNLIDTIIDTLYLARTILPVVVVGRRSSVVGLGRARCEVRWEEEVQVEPWREAGGGTKVSLMGW